MDELIDFKKRFLKNGELVSIPKKESYKRIMLLWAVSFWKAIKESCCYGPSLSLN